MGGNEIGTTHSNQIALILVDLQNDFCHSEGTGAKRGKKVKAPAFHEALENMTILLESARSSAMPIIHVISEHSDWSMSPRGYERFGRCDQQPHLSYCEPGSWGADIYHPFKPEPDEKVVIKHRYSAFLHTDLEMFLRSLQINQIIVIGLYTDVCIDSTVRDAYMRDFSVTIPYDCVTSDNLRLHHMTLELLKGTFADITHSHHLKEKLFQKTR